MITSEWSGPKGILAYPAPGEAHAPLVTASNSASVGAT
jgi:hypothetical protein